MYRVFTEISKIRHEIVINIWADSKTESCNINWQANLGTINAHVALRYVGVEQIMASTQGVIGGGYILLYLGEYTKVRVL